MPATARKTILIAAFATLASILPSWGQSLIGASDGLYRLDQAGRPELLLGSMDVRKIIKTGAGWYLLSSRGVLFSQDLSSFEERNKGFPIKIIKTYDKGIKGFANEIQEVKDLEVDPYDDRNLVACTKDDVFLSQDGGNTWRRIPSPAPQPGLKAVAVTSKPELLVFASHPIRGPFVRNGTNGLWKEISGELGKSDPGNNYPEEISDMVVRAGTTGPEVWAANSFLPRMYRYDFASSLFHLVYCEEAEFGTFESLVPRDDELLYVTDGAVMRLDRKLGAVQFAGTETMAVKAAAALISGRMNAYWSSSIAGQPLSLAELWLVSFKNEKPFKAFADGRFGLYLQTHFMVDPDSRARYNDLMDEHNMDMVVIDLKDDYGRLRFEPRNPLIRAIGRTVNPLDVEAYVTEMKAKGRYLVARIVVFKDKRLYEHAGGAYAVWDTVENKPWQGYMNETVEKTVMPPEGLTEGDNIPIKLTVTERKYYEEHWVDPYSEKVWEYNVAIAREIIERGFDEVQFDYIRFPTDGVNMANIRYRWRDSGMDMESALMSFLQYA
ncbi:MAG: putative glycoside hydrolase, partial [Spirochaetota bacterium]